LPWEKRKKEKIKALYCLFRVLNKIDGNKAFAIALLLIFHKKIHL